MRLVPDWIYWVAIGVLVAACGTEWVMVERGSTQLANYHAADAEAKRMAMLAQRDEETRRQTAIDKEAQDAQTRISALEGDLVTARGAAASLRNAATDAARRARAHPDVAHTSTDQPSQDPLDLLVYVLGRSDDTAGELAEYADRLRVAGATCERSYDALKSKSSP